jgi:hypothetical protein
MIGDDDDEATPPAWGEEVAVDDLATAPKGPAAGSPPAPRTRPRTSPPDPPPRALRLATYRVWNMVAISQKSAALGSLHRSMSHASVIHTV